jgi:uncharacterized surface protein with fasciclin (FAS1) repeats
MTRTILALTLLIAACAAKADSQPPANPEPEATAEPSPEASGDGKPADAAEPDDAAKPESKPTEQPAAAGGDLAAVIAARPNTKTFSELLTAAELDKDLKSSDVHLTILVPTDEAFDKLPKGTVDKWKKNKDALQKTLKYHFIPGVNDAQKVGNFRTAPTAAGPELEVKASQDQDLTIGGARLIEVDIQASNGVVHIVDKVLQPGGKKAK